MAEVSPSFERLSAYVDGELEPQEAAALSRLVAEDASIARTVAVLQELRAGVSEIPPDMVVLYPAEASRGSSRFALSRLRKAAAAACLALAVAGGAGWLAVGGWLLPAKTETAPVASLVELHDAWVGARTVNVFPASATGGAAAFLLAESGLTQVYGTEVAMAGSEGLVRHTAYLGSRGCRLSLFEITLDTGVAATAGTLNIRADGTLLTAEWDGERAHFIMVARNMDAARFATIATVMREAGERLDADDAERVAELHRTYQPCFA